MRWVLATSIVCALAGSASAGCWTNSTSGPGCDGPDGIIPSLCWQGDKSVECESPSLCWQGDEIVECRSKAALQAEAEAAKAAVRSARPWHLLTKSYGGTVSLVGGLSKETCEVARGKVMPDIRSQAAGMETPVYSPGDIEMAECFQ